MTRKSIALAIGLVLLGLVIMALWPAREDAGQVHLASPAASKLLSPSVASAEAQQPAVLLPTRLAKSVGIPLIDRYDPAYTTTLQLMERRLIPLLSQSKVVDALSDTELAELIGQLSTVWLSLAVHAASIAKVEVRPNNVVVITVPPHPQIGTAIEDYIFRELLHAKADENLMKSIRGSFMHLGKYPQTLEVSTMPTGTGGHDKPFYFILHRYDAMPFGPLVVGSGLQVTQLGPYSVFLRSFPPLPQ